MPVALVTSSPFATISDRPTRILEDAGFEVRPNPLGRRVTTEELAARVEDVDVLIAGVERIDRSVLERAPRLKLISRVGIGLDGIDFALCREFGVRVSYTPDAPTVAVSELNVGLALDVLRRISTADRDLRDGTWKTWVGGQLRGAVVGFLGFGRIGRTTAGLLRAFGPSMIAHDPVWDTAVGRVLGVERRTRRDVLEQADVLFVTMPLMDSTRGSIGSAELGRMRTGSVLVNTARGGIVDEDALARALTEGKLAGAALDVFGVEPYEGPLTGFDNVVMTCHMGASSAASREAMESGASIAAVRWLKGEPLDNEISESPYAHLEA